MNKIELFRLIGTISRKATTDVNQSVKEFELDNNHFLYLMRIVENEGLTQSNLVSLTKVDKTTLSRAISKLEKMNYVTKISSPDNKNFKEIYPTKKAKDVYNKLFDLERKYIDNALSKLTPLELVDLEKSLNLIKSSLE